MGFSKFLPGSIQNRLHNKSNHRSEELENSPQGDNKPGQDSLLQDSTTPSPSPLPSHAEPSRAFSPISGTKPLLPPSPAESDNQTDSDGHPERAASVQEQADNVETTSNSYLSFLSEHSTAPVDTKSDERLGQDPDIHLQSSSLVPFPCDKTDKHKSGEDSLRKDSPTPSPSPDHAAESKSDQVSSPISGTKPPPSPTKSNYQTPSDGHPEYSTTIQKQADRVETADNPLLDVQSITPVDTKSAERLDRDGRTHPQFSSPTPTTAPFHTDGTESNQPLKFSAPPTAQNSHLPSSILTRATESEPDISPQDQVPPPVCDVCSEDSPELCCLTCEQGVGIPYHERCWETERSHRPRRNQAYQIHRQTPIRSLNRLRYLNMPHTQTSVADSTIEEDCSNCFIEYDIPSERFRFGDRAFPLLPPILPHEPDQEGVQYPSFVSFVGRTMNGKSFLIRALQYKDAADRQPSPIPAPNAGGRNHNSTSSDIHLYADSETARDESPILFLDCEGFEGTDVPRHLRARLMAGEAARKRRELVEAVYPRLLYAFSTCIVFVTSGPLAESGDIRRRLISYAIQGASGSRNQGFKPSVFIIFNRFRDGNQPDFDWSIDASSKAFLVNEDPTELNNLYSSIRVVYIPSMNSSEAAIGFQQLDAFERELREKHKRASKLRQEFYLNFAPQELTPVLGRALDAFSKDRYSVVDWASEAPRVVFGSGESDPMLIDLWTQYTRHHTTPKSPQTPFDLIRTDFEEHVLFCLRLERSRTPPRGAHYTHVPPIPLEQVDRLYFEYTPCGATSPRGIKCEEVQLRHGDHHQGRTKRGSGVTRWTGTYEPHSYPTSSKLLTSFRSTLERDGTKKLSLGNFPKDIASDIRSIVSCLGCLQAPPSTVLACGHAFCRVCILELTDNDPLPHRRGDIRCPIHQKVQMFSPRLLPKQSGYRILSLDGGGVKSLAQSAMLRHIEQRCFGVPFIHLFDLVVGTGIGGQIALALTTQTGVPADFRESLKNAYTWKASSLSPLKHKTKYKAKPLESHLQNTFGKETKLFSAATSDVPNIAVTTVVFQSPDTYLVTNYNRKASPDPIPLLFGPTPNDCMTVWAAARCTSATFPLFKPLEWHGKMLVDGGFKQNCPASCAYSEGLYIWPDKRCDILLSLGTGTSMNCRPPPPKKRVRGIRPSVDDIADADKAFDEFLSNHLDDPIIRFNPVYDGVGFDLDDFRKLDEIEREVEEWISSQNAALTNICDRLIAALFFFHHSDSPVQAGEILCRLSPDVCQNLVHGMLQEENSKIFMVEYSETVMHVDVAEELKDLTNTAKLCLRVKLPVRLRIGSTIHVKMRGLGGHQREWFPIGGSPYVV